MKLLVADIGGTNARFGYQKSKESEIEHIEFFNCVDFKNIDHAILHYISKNKLVVDNLSLSIAGPCEDNLICLLYTSPSPRDTEVSRMPSSA